MRVLSCDLASEKNASCPKFRAMARTTVGAHPAQRAVMPSDLVMDVRASMTDL